MLFHTSGNSPRLHSTRVCSIRIARGVKRGIGRLAQVIEKERLSDEE